MKCFVYADNAATTKTDIEVFNAMKPWMLEEYGNASQPYIFARNSRMAIQDARESIARCINADSEEIFFTSGGSESDNWAIKGSAFSDSRHRQTVTSAFEHHAVIRSCEAIGQLGYPVVYINPTHDGFVAPSILEENLIDDTKLVSIMMANNEIGSIQPIEELCRIAHSKGAVFHTDAVQAVGHIPIDVKELGIDLLSASAHKFNGPKGVGFLFIKKGTPIVPLVNGGDQEIGMRAGTENVAGIVGMAVALKNNCENLRKNQSKLITLEERLLSGLKNAGIQFVRNGGEECLPGLVSLSFRDKDGEAILHRLDLLGISISTGSACDSKNTEISHVLKAIGLDKSLARGTIRISFGKDNAESDVDYIISALQKIVG